jgi:8-oxo-dGTP diphosphatase
MTRSACGGDRVLVVRRCDNGRWEPPGGVLELGESIPDGLRREVREETGLIVEPDALTGVYKNLARGVLALISRCHASGGVLASTTEADGFRWLHRDELAALLTPAYAVRLTDASDYAGTPAVRAHDGTQVPRWTLTPLCLASTCVIDRLHVPLGCRCPGCGRRRRHGCVEH